jgi:glycine oxidase
MQLSETETGAGPSVIVIGAGIIGLSAAWRLRQRGARVTVLERNPAPAQEASWAAAGMLSPFGENNVEGPMLDFGVESLRLFPQFLRDLAKDAGASPLIDFAGPGMIRLVFSENDLSDRKKSAEMASRHGCESKWLSREDVLALEPAVSPDCIGGVRSPEELHLDPRVLCDALRAAATSIGVRIFQHAEACGFDLSAGGVAGVRVNGDVLRADRYVITAGAWSNPLCRELGLEFGMFPRKGQMIRVKPGPSAKPFRYTLYMHSTYLVPRDGTVIIGATQEEVGFDRELSKATAGELFKNATEIVPSLRDAEAIDHWMGFRPATSDLMPVIGFAPRNPNVYIATGHLRNGILLCPATAAVVADEMMGGVRSDRWSAFSPSRGLPLS